MFGDRSDSVMRERWESVARALESVGRALGECSENVEIALRERLESVGRALGERWENFGKGLRERWESVRRSFR